MKLQFLSTKYPIRFYLMELHYSKNDREFLSLSKKNSHDKKKKRKSTKYHIIWSDIFFVYVYTHTQVVHRCILNSQSCWMMRMIYIMMRVGA